jgi:pimeloyl-ACP methyl ester carboxylesterase
MEPISSVEGTALPPTTASDYKHYEYGNDGEGWVRPPGTNRDAVVFVHGFTGNYHATWTWVSARFPFRKQRNVNLLGDLLTSEPDLFCDYYSYAHSSRNFDINGVRDLANALRTFLDNIVANRRVDGRVILVSHSLGGVICRQAVLNQLDSTVQRKVQIVGLLMMGTPNLGTEIARIALSSTSAENIKPWDDYLDGLNRDWLRRLVNGGDPDLDPAQRVRLKCGALYGLTDRVVPAASAKSGVYLGELSAVNKGHIALSKCKTKDDPVYRVLTQFIRDSLAQAEEATLRQSVDNLSYRVRRGILDKNIEWTYEESELIELTPHPSPKVLKCEITSTRIGWQPCSAVTVCLQLEGSAPKGIHVDFAYIYGRGALNESEYGLLGDNLKKASLTKEEFDLLMSVQVKLFATASGDAHTVALGDPKLITGPGFACLSFPLNQAELKGRDNRLQLTLKTSLQRHQAWYGYRARRTVLGETNVQVIAPFPLHPVTRLWWSDAHWENGSLGTNRYSSKVTIPGPLPAGTDIMWLFEPEAAV